jgi:exodeoxyribonuclease VII large subunit
MIKDPFARLGLDREVLTVSQLNGRARVLLEDVFTNIWVEGEISNLARPASGHVYFTLKDSGAQVRCALFRNNAARVRQALKDGLAVKVRGKVSLFEGRGDYQLILDTVEPAGDGALRLAFDEGKAQRRRPVQRRTQSAAARPSSAHRHYQFADGCGNPRHHQRVPPPGAER